MIDKRRAWILVAGLWLCLAGPLVAQNKPNNNDKKDEQRENERVKDAQRAVDQAQDRQKQAAKDLAEAEKRLNKAEAEKRKAIDNAQQARRAAEDRQEARLGLPALLKEQEGAQQNFDAAAGPVLKLVRTSPAYLAAVADAKVAQEELQIARKSNSLAAPDAEDALSALVRRTLKPGELERAALDADPSAQKSKVPLLAVQNKIKAARAQAKAAVEDDSTLREALKSLAREDAALDKAKSEVTRDRQKLSEAVAKVNQERGQLARAVAADRKDDNKPDNKKNDKKPNNKK